MILDDKDMAGDAGAPRDELPACREERSPVIPRTGGGVSETVTGWETGTGEGAARSDGTRRRAAVLSARTRLLLRCLAAAGIVCALMLPLAGKLIRAGRTPDGRTVGRGVLARLSGLFLSASLPPTGAGDPVPPLSGETESSRGADGTAFEESLTDPSEPPTEAGSDPSDEPQTSADACPERTRPAPEKETDPVPPDGDASETGTIPLPEPSPAVVTRDLSESGRGASYVTNEAGLVVRAAAGWQTWTDHPVVLIVTSHPYESYIGGDGAGTVQTLAVRLTAALRERGLRVVLLRPTDCTPDSSLIKTYDQAQTLAARYCRMYGDAALVLDLRRSAELTDPDGPFPSLDGSSCLLRTEGRLDGAPSAQLRLTVDAHRGGQDGGGALRADLAAALELRERLFRVSPTVSRPVRLRAGSGLIPAGTTPGFPCSPILLTVELGAAGNSFSEAAALIAPFADAVAGMVGE